MAETIAYLIEDGQTILRLVEKGYLDEEKAIDALVQITEEMEVEAFLLRSEKLFREINNNICGLNLSVEMGGN
jgi:hypothetical protein